MNHISGETLLVIQQHFHQVIRSRAAKLIERHNIKLPTLTYDEGTNWFRVPGMYGGFRYWWEGEGKQLKLMSESWCRVAGGSRQRHEITEEGSSLVDVDFV